MAKKELDFEEKTHQLFNYVHAKYLNIEPKSDLKQIFKGVTKENFKHIQTNYKRFFTFDVAHCFSRMNESDILLIDEILKVNSMSVKDRIIYKLIKFLKWHK